MAPQAPKGTAFQKYSGANARPVVNCIPLDFKNKTLSRRCTHQTLTESETKIAIKTLCPTSHAHSNWTVHQEILFQQLRNDSFSLHFRQV
jgi:hypothetical protein